MRKQLAMILCFLLILGITSVVFAAEEKLTGTPFGLDPPWAAGSEYDKVWDGDTTTFYDYIEGSGGYTGLDLGEAKVITKIKFYPREGGYLYRMVGGKFQGSNSKDDGYVDLHVITEQPQQEWIEVSITDTTAYRYVRYLSADEGFGNVAEIELYGYADASTPKTGDKGIVLYIIAAVLSLGAVVALVMRKQFSSTK